MFHVQNRLCIMLLVVVFSKGQLGQLGLNVISVFYIYMILCLRVWLIIKRGIEIAKYNYLFPYISIDFTTFILKLCY